MVQVDLPAAFTIGQVLAILSKKYLKQEPAYFKNKLTGPLNFYLSCCFAPVGMFLLIAWPAWEVMYVSDWVELPYNKPLVAGFYVLFNIVMVLLGNIGFILAHKLYHKNKDKVVVFIAIIGAFLTILPFILKWGIWMKVGTMAEISNTGGYSFWDPPFVYGWLVFMGYLVITTIIAGLYFKNHK